MKNIPYGMADFKDVVSNYYYIDKTKYIPLLEQYGNFLYFIRPRRFGKSLFLDTLKCAYEGKKELFEDLYIYDRYEFDRYPVIKIDWAGNFKTLESTKEVAQRIFDKNQER